VTAIPLAPVPSLRPPARAALRAHVRSVALPERSTALTSGRWPDDGDRSGPLLQAGLLALVDELRRGCPDPGALQRAVGALTGLGPGLTPTGDDILVALVATSGRLSNGSLIGAVAAERLSAAVAALPAGRTTAAAARLLAGAVQGRFPEPLAAFVAALGDPAVARETIAGLAAQLAAVGAHSGADWLAATVALASAAAPAGGLE